MTNDDAKGSEGVPLRPCPSNPFPPMRLIRAAVLRLPEASAPRPITDKQAKYITDAAGLQRRADDSPDKLLEIAEAFYSYRINEKTTRVMRDNWSVAREKARELLLAIQPLTDDDHMLVTALTKFSDEAEEVIDHLDSVL